ncbi:IniB N-terminal domain-containing protein [Micromonospora sp. NBC_01699]|uniref:IniB N-terminal domain-containing protein n=1 Tax=Micromonospora sp. NBC_01699 TaxID=2975984 RepID=UPI002E2DF87F|nr:IniB N-terminal domain-containing protein [Micromonospora sp. NBC_01699]
MDSTQNLHDFVLNLLTDVDARSAFELDPEATLADAGLGDLTPADVQDVIPFVVDTVPLQGITALAPVGDLGGLAGLDGGALGVVGQLNAVADQITSAGFGNSVDVNAGMLGAITVDPTGLGAAAAVIPGIGAAVSPAGLATDLSGVNDVANTLDLGVVGTSGVTGVVDTTQSVVNDPTGAVLDGTATDGLLGTADFAVNTVTGLTHITGLTDSLDVGGLTGGLTDGLTDGLNGVPVVGDVVDTHGVLGGVTSTVGGTLGSTGLTGDLGLGADAHATADTHAATGGLLGITDGLL